MRCLSLTLRGMNQGRYGVGLTTIGFLHDRNGRFRASFSSAPLRLFAKGKSEFCRNQFAIALPTLMNEGTSQHESHCEHPRNSPRKPSAIRILGSNYLLCFFLAALYNGFWIIAIFCYEQVD